MWLRECTVHYHCPTYLLFRFYCTISHVLKKLLTYILSEIVQKYGWYFTWEKNPLTLARTSEEMDGILYTYIVDHPSMMSQRKTLWGLSSWKIPQKYSVKTSRGLPKGSFLGTSLTVHPPPLVPQVEMWFSVVHCPILLFKWSTMHVHDSQILHWHRIARESSWEGSTRYLLIITIYYK